VTEGTDDKGALGGGKMVDLGTLGGFESTANGINDAGQIVGVSNELPFIYFNGIMTNLNTLIPSNSGWTLDTANAINDSGQIVGSGINPSGIGGAYLLTPVPEPASAGLISVGMMVLLARRRRSFNRG